MTGLSCRVGSLEDHMHKGCIIPVLFAQGIWKGVGVNYFWTKQYYNYCPEITERYFLLKHKNINLKNMHFLKSNSCRCIQFLLTTDG